MGIKVLSSDEAEFRETDVQKAFEQDLSKLYEGLEFIDREVIIPVGRIDTLAFDSNTNQPVFIEYKAGEFGKDALIQLMDYLSWFIRDGSHYDTLKRIIRQKRPEIQEIESDIRLICVVMSIEDRIKNAIYAIANDALVFSYVVANDTAGNTILVPKLEVDNSEVERGPRVSATEEELLKRYPKQTDLFAQLKVELTKNGAEAYIKGRTFRFRKHRVFALVRLRNNHTRLQLHVGRGHVSDPEFKYAKKGASDWGAIILTPDIKIPEKVKQWIEAAREFIPTKIDEEDDNESDEENQS